MKVCGPIERMSGVDPVVEEMSGGGVGRSCPPSTSVGRSGASSLPVTAGVTQCQP